LNRSLCGPLSWSESFGGERNVLTNEELDKLIKHKNVVNYIKAQRISWFGHVQRMPDTRTVKNIFKWKPLKKITRKTQVQMGGSHQTGYLSNED
jgi:hypothetical protein